MSKRIILNIMINIILLVQLFAQTADIRLIDNHIRTQEKTFLSDTFQTTQSTTNQKDYDITFYEIKINVPPQLSEIEGHVTIHGISLIDTLSEIYVNLYKNMTIDSIKQSSFLLPYERPGNLIKIQLIDTIPINSIFSIDIYYRGYPCDPKHWCTGHQNYYTLPVIYTQSEPYGTSTWWPCKDNLWDKADSVSISVTVPLYLDVASNGNLLSVVNNDDVTHTFNWKTHYPIAPYLVSIAISDYEMINDLYISSNQDTMPIQYFVYPNLVDLTQTSFSKIPDMIQFFSSIFGEYPFLEEKYGMVITPDQGAMENQTITSYSHFYVDGSHQWDWLIAHELAHQWFGDCVTIKSWSDIWLNEGFARYSEALWDEFENGKEAYFEKMKQLDYASYYEETVIVDDTTNLDSIFSITVYNKGAWVLHMLRKVLGDENFFNSLYAYANHPEYKYKSVLTEDFQQTCETISGMQLDWFFEQWLYREGRPYYTYSWQTIGNGPYQTSIFLTQINTDVYEMPIDIQLSYTDSDTFFTVWNNLQTQEYTVTTNFEPTHLDIDPVEWILKHIRWTPYTGTDKINVSLPTKWNLKQNYPNPFNSKTIIEYSLPQQDLVTLKIFNMLGEEIQTLTNSLQNSGKYKLEFDGSQLKSGIYLCVFKSNHYTVTKKMILER